VVVFCFSKWGEYRPVSKTFKKFQDLLLEVATMKKIITAVLAALMLAGALCAISGAAPIGQYHSVAIVGEGTSPFPMLMSPNSSTGQSTLAGHF
jgi:hypothetical protein